MPTLYTMPGTCSLAPNIAIAWLDAPVQTVNLPYGDHRKEPFLALNPRGKVPVLKFEYGDVLTESVAILAWLAAMHGTGELALEQVQGRKAAEALSYMSSDVRADFGPHFAASQYAESKSARDEVKRRAYARLGVHFRRLDDTVRANGGSWYLGVRSLADTYLYVLTRWLEQTPMSIANYASLAQHRRRMQADSGVRLALERQGMDVI